MTQTDYHYSLLGFIDRPFRDAVERILNNLDSWRVVGLPDQSYASA
jgi:hypothetical protein